MKAVSKSMKRGLIAAFILGVLTLSTINSAYAAVINLPNLAGPKPSDLLNIGAFDKFKCMTTPGCYCKLPSNSGSALCRCRVASDVSLGCCTAGGIMCSEDEKKKLDDIDQNNRIQEKLPECKDDVNSDACKAALAGIAECKDNPLSQACKDKMKSLETPTGEQGAPTEDSGLTDAEIAARAEAQKQCLATGKTVEECKTSTDKITSDQCNSNPTDACCKVYSSVQACKDREEAKNAETKETVGQIIKDNAAKILGTASEGLSKVGSLIQSAIAGAISQFKGGSGGDLEGCNECLKANGLCACGGCGDSAGDYQRVCKQQPAVPEVGEGKAVCGEGQYSTGSGCADNPVATGKYLMSFSGESTQVAFSSIPGTGVAKVTSCDPPQDLHFKLEITNQLTGAVKISCVGKGSDYDQACGVLYQCKGSGTINKLRTFASGTNEVLSCIPSFKRVECEYDPNDDESWAISIIRRTQPDYPRCVGGEDGSGGFFAGTMSIPSCQRFIQKWELRQ